MNQIEESLWMTQATLYELTSLGLLLPTLDLSDALSNGEYAESCKEVMVQLDLSVDVFHDVSQLLSSYQGEESVDVFHEIRREYTRLFVGEREPLIMPYVGVWEARRKGQKGVLFIGEESLAIERCIKKAGLAKDLSAGQLNDPLDHIGTVCEYMKYLCLVHAKAIAIPEGFVVSDNAFEEFFCTYYRPYAQWCAQQIELVSRSNFYKSIGILLKVTAMDHRFLD